jgi:hypothetical protein
MDPNPEQVVFDTIFDTANAQYTVGEQAGTR